MLDACSADSRNLASPCDTDIDGYGNVCDPDFDQSNFVNATDFSMFFSPDFKASTDGGTGTDMDCSGSVNATDFSAYFSPIFNKPEGENVPGPSGLTCAGTAGCK